MKMHNLLGATALASSLLVGAPTLAQTTVPIGPGAAAADQAEPASTASADGSAAGSDDAIVVTGSRIRAPNIESTVPVTAVSGAEFFQRASTNVGDYLNELPQLRSTFSQQNSGRALGTTGLNLLDLRGLGPQRTLVLVNGRRHVASDILNNAASPDVNTIPNDLIERVDVVTGGNSAVYGSDAIAGVVNFILRRDFQGVQLRGHTNISEYGAGGGQYVSALAGINFGEGRGNITVHGEYAHQDRVFASDVPFLRRVDGLGVVDTDPAGLVNGSDGIPDRVFIRDIRSASIYFNGLVPITQPAGAAAQCGIGIQNGAAAGLPYNCTYLFNNDGSLIPQTGTRYGTGIIGGITGGNGQTGREGNTVSILPFQERANFNLLAHYQISEALEPFVEAKYVRVRSQGQNSGPGFVQGSTFGDARERARLDNPFLSSSARATISGAILTSGFVPSLSARTALTDANRAQIAAGTFRFPVARNLLDLGIRDEYSERETYRIAGGLRGTFNDDWSYEVSANYGRVNEDTTILGNLNSQRFLLSIDAGRNPATGQIQCRSQFDPAARIDYVGTDQSAALLAADIAACVPYNPFGAPDNSAARAYIVQDTVSKANITQFVGSAFVSGDLSQLFELPGGPIRFAVGGEYRRETAFFQADPLVEQGFTFYNALPTFKPAAFEVKEAYGELNIPLLRDFFLADELTVTGAARVADYKGTTGTVYAYNAGLVWAPVRDVKFRGAYGRSVRAPNYTETAFPLSQNFAPAFQDPCRPTNIGSGTQFRAANCQSDLGALLNDPSFQALPNYSLEIQSGSNTELKAETSDSYTAGVVIQPRWTPGFSITVDYFNIKVNKVITAPTAQQIVNGCYDLPTLDNQFCSLFTRFRGPGLGPVDEVPGQILQTSLISIPLNYAALKRRGLDVEVAYTQKFGIDRQVSTRLLYTHQFQNSNFTNPSTPDFENRILSELGDPQDEYQWNVDLKLSPLTLGYQMRYIGKQVPNFYEDFYSLQGRAPQDADYADTRAYQAVTYHNARADLEVSDKFTWYFGIDNLTDVEPPLGTTATGAGTGIYNVRGRSYYSGFRARF